MRSSVGVISDTHGLARDEALQRLAGVDLIIHAGDVGKPAVLNALSRIAPVQAVRGNVDTGAWAERLPLFTVAGVQNVRIFVLHNIADLDFDPSARGFAAIVFGHSHKATREMRNRTLYLNPGSAGPRRFRLPVTVARMIVEDGSVRAEILTLEV